MGLLTGIADASFDQCVMRSNVAYMGGGAISFDGTTTTRLLIERSILEENIKNIRGNIFEQKSNIVRK